MSLETTLLRQIRAHITIQRYDRGNLYKRLFIYACCVLICTRAVSLGAHFHACICFFSPVYPCGKHAVNVSSYQIQEEQIKAGAAVVSISEKQLCRVD